jgi:membrane-associated phospholipid phosphatase
VLDAIVILVLVYHALGTGFDRWNSALLRRLVSFRTNWLTSLTLSVNSVLASRWTIRVLRLGTLIALIGLRRWRHLLTFLVSVVAVEVATFQLSILVASPRPIGMRIIGTWHDYSFPSAPVAALAVTLVGMAYALLPHGRLRSRGGGQGGRFWSRGASPACT